MSPPYWNNLTVWTKNSKGTYRTFDRNYCSNYADGHFQALPFRRPFLDPAFSTSLQSFSKPCCVGHMQNITCDVAETLK